MVVVVVVVVVVEVVVVVVVVAVVVGVFVFVMVVVVSPDGYNASGLGIASRLGCGFCVARRGPVAGSADNERRIEKLCWTSQSCE